MKCHSAIRYRSFVCESPRRQNADGVAFPRRRMLRWCLGIASLLTLERSPSSQARIPTDALPLRRPPRNNPTSDRSLSPPLNVDIQQQVAEIQSLTQKAESAFADRDYLQAFELYDKIVTSYPQLAVTEYARLHRALLLYQLEDVRECILELDDLEVALRGYPEVHAALAVVMYTNRPLQLNRAEEQWDVATIFDRRYEDVQWVKQMKMWPPKMLEALDRFLTLR